MQNVYSVNEQLRCEDVGAKPENQSQIEYDFETVHNLDIYGCELAPTVREGMRAWNMTVQYWLANYVYKRVPFKSGPLRYSCMLYYVNDRQPMGKETQRTITGS